MDIKLADLYLSFCNHTISIFLSVILISDIIMYFINKNIIFSSLKGFLQTFL